MARRVLRVLVGMAVALAVGGRVGSCGREGARGAGDGGAGRTGGLRVVVSIAPLKGFVEALVQGADGKVPEVSLLVPVGALEHGYEMPPEMVARALNADVVVYVGLGIEPGLQKILNEHPSKARREVCFAEVVGIQAGLGADADHDGAGHDEHGHGGVDPHIWLDPSLVEKLIPAVRRAVEDATAARGGRGSDGGSGVAGAEAGLLARLREMDEKYRGALDGLRGRELITAHAAWGRLCERYGLVQVPLAGMEASEPSPAALARASAVLREHPGATVFTELQLAAGAAKRLAEAAKARVGVLDPLGDGDWFSMMETNLNSIRSGLSGAGKGADTGGGGQR